MKADKSDTVNDNQAIPDAHLVTLAKAGELSAFDALVHRHERAAYSLARRMLQNEQDAEDVTQQAFLSAVLDEKHRLVFLLRDVEGMSVKETAETLGLGESNVKVRLLRARLQLREHLTRTLGDPRTRIERGDSQHD